MIEIIYMSFCCFPVMRPFLLQLKATCAWTVLVLCCIACCEAAEVTIHRDRNIDRFDCLNLADSLLRRQQRTVTAG